MPADAPILLIDARRDGGASSLATLREKLSPRGDVVSEAGRQRTIDTFGEAMSPVQVVERICNDVRRDGLSAVLGYTQKLDRAKITAATLRVTAGELAVAHQAASPEFLGTIRRVRDNILFFQEAILHHNVEVPLAHGGYLRQRYVPIRRVGICVPGGAAAYPSTVLMTAVPAMAAGVSELAVVAPPTKFGANNPDLLATCHELGIREVYRVGGAQAVAALAYGVEGIARVDKIVGPGNLFVALAKQRVFGEVDIDSIAGPSEVVVIASDPAQADWVAADLLAQAEHSPGSSILVTWSEELADAVQQSVVKQLALLDRGDLAAASLSAFGAIVLVTNAEQACQLANDLAPEHLHILADDAERLLAKIPNAGAAFLGPYSPVAVGDYVAGPSHVLPTGGTARFASGLSANSFLRAGSVIHFTKETLAEAASDVQRLAEKEGLTAHWESVKTRLGE